MVDVRYTLAGGNEGLQKLASAFYRRMFADPIMLPLFADPDADHAGRLALFLGEYFGGHAEHTRQRGGRETMAHIHEGLRISNLQRDRWIEHMHAACKETGMPREFIDSLEPNLQYFADLAQKDSWA